MSIFSSLVSQFLLVPVSSLETAFEVTPAIDDGPGGSADQGAANYHDQGECASVYLLEFRNGHFFYVRMHLCCCFNPAGLPGNYGDDYYQWVARLSCGLNSALASSYSNCSRLRRATRKRADRVSPFMSRARNPLDEVR